MREFLSTILADLTEASVGDEGKSVPLERRVDQFFTELHKRAKKQQKVLFVLDNVHLIFPSVGAWSASWSAFFERFARDSHSATMYVMTQTWPGLDHPLPFVERTDLPALSLVAAVSIWHHFGFRDVPEETLEKISVRCGYNPRLIELLVAWCQKSTFGVRWGRTATVVSGSSQSANTQKLEMLLAQDSIFETRMDTKTRTVLQSVMSSELSHQAKAMLECLACSPLGLPVPLLAEDFVDALDALNDLESASALDLSQSASNRAALVPFVRESVLLSLAADGRRDAIESRVTDLYNHWLQEVQDFKDDREMAGLIAEMIVRYLRQRQLLKAADLFIQFSWLCTAFGQITRIHRIFEEVVTENRSKEMGAAYEVGRLLLSFHVNNRLGQPISRRETESIYQDIRDEVTPGDVILQPHTEIDLLHNMMLKHIRLSLFKEAEQAFEEVLAHIRQQGQVPHDVYASYLHNKSRLFARWSEFEKRAKHQEEAHHLLSTCVEILEQCIAEWRKSLKRALPLQNQYFRHKLARALNDYAYRERLLGNLQVAQESIEESVRLKKACMAPTDSLAVSLGEYAQILMLQGKHREAEHHNGEAVAVMRKAIEDGNATLDSELGMLLVERDEIYMRQASRLDEEELLLKEAVESIGEDSSRKSYREKAEKRLREIQLIRETAQIYQLDRQWFTRYRYLVSYDELAWLQYAGPFTEDEQREWDYLSPQRGKEGISDKLDALVVQSRQLEFARGQEEQCAPKLWYPSIPLEEVQDRIKGFATLKEEIEGQETNAVVRQLYIDTINEHIKVLHLCEAIALQDQDAVWNYNQQLYERPSVDEMTIALQSFCAMLLRSQDHEQAGPVAQGLLTQLRSWSLSPQELAVLPPLVPRQDTGKQQAPSSHPFSYETIQRFFQDVFHTDYGATEWHVAIAPARTGPYVNANLQTLFLPPRAFTLEEVRDILGEEIETHAYRAMSGMHSPLALLGSGVAGYLPTEEGLGEYYMQQIAQMHGKHTSKSWLSTLCIGLATGIMTPVLSFLELCSFLEKALLVNLLRRKENSTREELLVEARDEAWKLAARTFRGVPDLSLKGCCSLKDNIYLRGYMSVAHFLEAGNEQRLYVGKIGIEHLDAMNELNILSPFYPHRRLALAPDLFERVSQYESRLSIKP